MDDATGAGKSCDTADDLSGRIFTERLFVLDASHEIPAAVLHITPTFTGAGVIEPTSINFAGLLVAGGSTAAACAATNTVEKTAVPDHPMAATTATGPCISRHPHSLNIVAQTSAPTAAAVNIQPFTGVLVGAPHRVTSTTTHSSRVSVNGAAFAGRAAAPGGTCDVQHKRPRAHA